MPANDIFEVSVDATYNGEAMTNVMHFIQIGADGTGDARSALNSVWVNDFDVAQRNLQVDSVTHFQQRTRRLFPTQTQSFIAANSATGTFIDNGLPTNQCAILRFYGALAGRKGVGHQKLYGVGTTFILQGRISASYKTLMDAYGDIFKVDRTDSSGFVFRAGVLGTDDVLRQIQKTEAMTRIKQVHSRSARVGA